MAGNGEEAEAMDDDQWLYGDGGKSLDTLNFSSVFFFQLQKRMSWRSSERLKMKSRCDLFLT